MKVALAQLNLTIGDFAGNLGKIREALVRARAQRADLLILPELGISGYPPGDLLERASFLRDHTRALEELVPESRDIAILTDSGGYQVHSLATRRRVDDDGVTFQSHLDGSSHRIDPESAVDAQVRFGVDIAMVLDECLPFDAEPPVVERAAGRTVAWALRGLRRAGERRQGGAWGGGLFAIQQGGADPVARGRCSEALAEHPFDGFAVGGLAVGEPQPQLHDSVAAFAPLLPADRPRYLMGVGYPEDLLHAVACGIDLFDCVLPTRSARTGKLFTSRGKLNIKNARHADDDRPPDPECACPTCARYSRGALRHLYVAREATSVVLLTVHNLNFFLSLMRGAREAIIAGRYSRFRTRVELARMAEADEDVSADAER
jgi:queuine tRNA-ribosyltransferase